MPIIDTIQRAVPGFPALTKAAVVQIRDSLADAVNRLNAVFRYFQGFGEFTITEKSGRKITVLGKNRTTGTSGAILFDMFQTGTTATVRKGMMLVTKWPASLAGDTMPAPTKQNHPLEVPEAVVTLTPGNFVYLKLTYTTKTANPKGDLSSDGAVSFAGGTVTGGLGGYGGDGGGGGGGGSGGGGGGGGGSGTSPGAGGAGARGDNGDSAAGIAGGAGGSGPGAGSPADGAGGTPGAPGGGGAYGGSGGDGMDGGDGGYGQIGQAPPAVGYPGGPTEVIIPAFTSYKKVRLSVTIKEITAGQIVCEAVNSGDGYIPLAEVKGTAEAPILEPWHPGGYITPANAITINIVP